MQEWIEMFPFAVIVLLFAAALVIVSRRLFGKAVLRREPLDINHAELEAAEKALRDSDAIDWVVLQRCHGPAYNHGAMTAIISALVDEGVPATYDVIGTSSADGGVTNFMLKVERGQEERAREILARIDEARPE